jgi:hypothetical protein
MFNPIQAIAAITLIVLPIAGFAENEGIAVLTVCEVGHDLPTYTGQKK